MKREIKYRAWDIEAKIMFYNIHELYDGYGNITDRDGKELDIYESTHCNVSSFSGWISSDNPVMQFTGLKDGKGNEVYEGDIVYHKGTKSPKEHIFEVVWRDYRWKFSKKNGGHPFSQILNHPENFKVIGNVWEHPHLLSDPRFINMTN